MDAHTETAPQYGKYFLACVRINLSNLRYAGKNDRQEKRQKIDKLRSLLIEDCDRNNPDNFINALISKEALQNLRLDNSPEQFGTWRQTPPISSPVNISPSAEITYGDGYSRIQAAKECFPLQDQWWVVNLYDRDIGPGFLLSQRNRNNRSTADPSGIEVRELLKLRSQDDQTAAQQLALGLSKNSRKDLKAIKNRSKLDSALGALRDIPGLWAALNGGLKRTSLEGSDDELICCLKNIRDWWYPFLSVNGRLVEAGANMVDLLDTRAPGRSLTDRELIIKHMDNGSFFGMEDSQTRDHLKAKTLSTTSMIPTLKTYSRDTMHLREIVYVLRLLLGPNDKLVGPRNIRPALKRIWKGPEMSQSTIVEDMRDGEFVKLTTSQPFDCFDIQLKSLVLHVMRGYRPLGNFAARTEPGEEKAKIKEATALNLYLYGLTARTLGFWSDEIERLSKINVPRQTFAKSLQDIAPRDEWEYDLDAAVDRQCLAYQESVRSMKKRLQACDKPRHISEMKLDRRYGKPVTAVLDQSAPHLFLRHLCSSAAREGQGVTAHTIRTEFLFRFWGSLELENPEFSKIDTSSENSDTQGVAHDDATSVYSDDVILNDGRLREDQEYREVRDQLQIAEAQIKMYTAEGAEKDAYVKVLKAEVEKEKELVAQLNTKILQKDKELAELRKDNEAKLRLVNTLESEADTAHHMIIDGSQDIESSHLAEDVLSKKIQSLQDENDRRRQEEEKQVQTLVDQAAKKEQRLEVLRSEIEELKKCLKMAEDLADEARRRSEEDNKSNEEVSMQYQETISQMQKEVDEAKAENSVAGKASDEKMKSLESQLADLQKELDTKTQQLELLGVQHANQAPAEESGAEKQVQSTKSPRQRALEALKQDQIEQQIQRLMREVDKETLHLQSIQGQTGAMMESLRATSNVMKISDAQIKQFKKDNEDRKRKLRALQREESKLEKETIPILKTKLTDARYELLAIKGVEVLFYERHPETKDIISRTPTRIPLEAGRLYDKFKSLQDEKYTVSCLRSGQPTYCGFDDFQQWKIYLADPPGVDNETFFIETFKSERKRMAGKEQLTISKRAKKRAS